MSRRPRRRKHVPHRTCVACRTGRAKRELVRVVRTPEGAIVIDETGKRNGRGAYLCRQTSCWKTAISHRHLERALNTEVPAEAQAQLMEYAAGLPQPLTAEDTPLYDTAAKGVDQDE